MGKEIRWQLDVYSYCPTYCLFC